MKPSLKLQLNRETLRQLGEQEVQNAAGAGVSIASCRIVSCALPCVSAMCFTVNPARCNY